MSLPLLADGVKTAGGGEAHLAGKVYRTTVVRGGGAETVSVTVSVMVMGSGLSQRRRPAPMSWEGRSATHPVLSGNPEGWPTVDKKRQPVHTSDALLSPGATKNVECSLPVPKPPEAQKCPFLGTF